MKFSIEMKRKLDVHSGRHVSVRERDSAVCTKADKQEPVFSSALYQTRDLDLIEESGKVSEL